MKTIQKNRYKLRQIFSLFLLSFLIPSCMVDEHEEVISKGGSSGGSDHAQVTFELKLPGAVSMGTKALNYEQENHVEEITLLIFNPDSKEFITHLTTDNITDSISDSRYKKFSLTLPQGRMDLVILANAWKPIIKECFPSGITTGTKEEILKQMILTHTGRWVSDKTGNGYIPIPMWGSVEEATITGDSRFTANNAIPMVRMLSKIDVEVTGSALTNFNLHEVYLYNRNTKGQLVPTENGNWDDTEKKVLRPEVPTGTTLTKGPLPYKDSDITTPLIASNSVIYTMEAIAGTEEDYLDNTCLVIGGDYEKKGKVTYYRIDFYSDTIGYIPLLRNHLYQIRIKGISGAGYNTPDEAFSAKPQNIEVDILPWNDGGMTEIVFDGQYLLSVSQGEFNLARESTVVGDKHNMLTVYTDYETGWKVEKIVDEQENDISNGWLRVNITSGAANIKQATYLILEQNMTLAPRTGYIHIRAGRLTYVVKVIQSHIPEIRLAIYEGNGSTGIEVSELTFHGIPQGTQQFTVDWLPRSAQPVITVTPVENMGFTFDTSAGLDMITTGGLTGGTPGNRTYNIRPTTLSTNTSERSSRVDFTVTNGESYLTKSIYLRQLNFALTVIDKKDTYILDEEMDYFTIRANASWTAQITHDPKGILAGLDANSTYGTGNITETIRFRTTNDLQGNPKIFDGTATITFTNHLFGSVDVEIHCVSGVIQPVSNSYIVKPNGNSILIPVKRANEHNPGVIGSNTGFDGELVWTDNFRGIDDDSNIKAIRPVGKGPDGYIMVTPGAAEGNAVIAVKINTTIVWSWHIWVTDYEPESDHENANGKRLMDRNLGALSSSPDPNSTKAFGLLYQWGRKDPFPGSASPTQDIEPTLYADGRTTAIERFSVHDNLSDGENNLNRSVENPLMFFYNGWPPSDWYAKQYTAEHDSDRLWNLNNKKTIYDPCPDGWRVPPGEGDKSPWGEDYNYYEWKPELPGMIYRNKAYYPAGGYRGAPGSGYEINYTGKRSIYWTTAIADYYSRGMLVSEFIRDTSGEQRYGYGPYSRSNALSVRCMQE